MENSLVIWLITSYVWRFRELQVHRNHERRERRVSTSNDLRSYNCSLGLSTAEVEPIPKPMDSIRKTLKKVRLYTLVSKGLLQFEFWMHAVSLPFCTDRDV